MGVRLQTRTAVRGGLATVRTDQNGQARVDFPEPFPNTPAAILATPKDNLIAVGTLVLNESYVMLWVWDLVTGAWYRDQDVEVYWLGLFGS